MVLLDYSHNPEKYTVQDEGIEEVKESECRDDVANMQEQNHTVSNKKLKRSLSESDSVN